MNETVLAAGKGLTCCYSFSKNNTTNRAVNTATNAQEPRAHLGVQQELGKVRQMWQAGGDVPATL
jgi:hypothetical protein